MAKLSYKASYYVLYAMLAVILVVIGLFVFGGSAEGQNIIATVDADMWQPKNTDVLMYTVYLLLGVAVTVTLLTAILQFAITLKDRPKEALQSLLGGIILAAVLGGSWYLGSDSVLNIPGYDGPDNVAFWLKITDMFLYTFYILMGVSILSVILSFVKKLVH